MAFVKSTASNHKLDIFLKRNLPCSEYQKIRCYEQCVVEKTLKLALLTNTNLLISDTPPRTLQYILPLKSISGVDLVQELPDFLRGSERETAQHIAIRLHKDQASQCSKHLTGSSSPEGSGRSSPLLWSYIPQSTQLATNLMVPDQDGLTGPRSQMDVNNNNFLSASLNDSGYSGSSNSLTTQSSLSSSFSSFSLSHSHGEPVRSAESPVTHRSPHNKRDTLDLFLLTADPTFFKLLKTSLLNGKIQETLNLDFTQPRKTKASRKKKDSAREHQLFTQLSEEIQHSLTLEGSFALVRELTTAVNNNCAIKGYFWKDASLLRHMIGQFRRYCVHNNNNRADEIEYLVLLSSSLCLLMRETDHLPCRSLLLTANSNAVFRDLLSAICTEPSTKYGISDSVEVEGLCQELTDTNAGLLHEVMLFATEQPKWGCDISMTLFINTLESAPYFKVIIDNMVSRAFSMLSQDRPCSIQQILILFHFFSLLETVLKYSAYLSVIVKSKYSEEIRYYCNNHSSKIVRVCPIQELTISRIQSVIDEVTKTP